jgi:nitrogen fixation protein FixH
MSRPAPELGPGRDLWIPWTIGAGFAAFLLAAVVLSVIAARSDPGLVAGSPASKVAGSYIMSTAPAPALDMRVVQRRGGEIEVEARLLRPDGGPGRATMLTAVVHRPTDSAADHAVSFTERPDGTWRVTLRLSGPGAWDLAVVARDAAGGEAAASLRL